MELSRKEYRLLEKEGFSLFDATGSVCNEQGNWPFQVQRLDEAAVFPDDEGAWNALLAGARKGKRLYLKVLQILRQESKPELSQIYLHTVGRGEGLDRRHHQLTNDLAIDLLETEIFGRVVSR